MPLSPERQLVTQAPAARGREGGGAGAPEGSRERRDLGSWERSLSLPSHSHVPSPQSTTYLAFGSHRKSLCQHPPHQSPYGSSKVPSERAGLELATKTLARECRPQTGRDLARSRTKSSAPSQRQPTCWGTSPRSASVLRPSRTPGPKVGVVARIREPSDSGCSSLDYTKTLTLRSQRSRATSRCLQSWSRPASVPPFFLGPGP